MLLWLNPVYLVHFSRAKEESDAMAKNFKQKTPETISEEDLLSFNLRDEFQLLRSECPLLYRVLAGAMGLREDQLEVINIIPTVIEKAIKSGTQLLHTRRHSSRSLPPGATLPDHVSVP